MEHEIDSMDIQVLRNEWKKKSWSIPELRGGKECYYDLVVGLVNSIASNEANDLNSIPNISALNNLRSWQSYIPFLKGMGLIINNSGVISLSEIGRKFYDNPSKIHLANIIQNKIRLFAETLAIIEIEPLTIQDIDKIICNRYSLDWVNLSNTRKRMDWLEVLGLIQGIGNRKWQISAIGISALKSWKLIAPEIVESPLSNDKEITIEEAPYEISLLLQQLEDSPEKHEKRVTYNLWAPSPNRIENLRKIINYAFEKVSKIDLFKYIEDEFNLKASSVESMMPFLKAAGYLEEVGRGIYSATAASKAWIETGNDLDFIRILHAHMRFVGEMIVFAKDDVVRNDVYFEAKKYGLNNEKARWIAGFLIEANLLEETQYLHLKATTLGLAFSEHLPLADLAISSKNEVPEKDSPEISCIQHDEISVIDRLIERLKTASCDPVAFGKASGVAFEEVIADVFSYLGFDAKRIGGAGDTDVVIHWIDDSGQTLTAILDAKSKSSGQVSHTDVSDVAIDTHKEKNNADYVAIVGHGFSGDTIKNHARKKKYALITVDELSEMILASKKYGLSLQDIALIFEVPDGLSKIGDLISLKQRKLDIITKVISKFYKEQESLGSLSPRDLLLLLRDDDISPTLEELIDTFDILASPEIGLLKVESKSSSPQNVTYTINNCKKVINRLRSLANAIEDGLD